MTPKLTNRAAFGLLGLTLLLFFINIWGYDLWPPDEPRFAEVAREMLQSHNFLAPYINGLPYKEKPPLLFWAICAASKPLGGVTEFSARIPSALAALLTVFFVFLLARRLTNQRTAFWSGVILSTTLLFWWEARTVHTDMLMTAGLTGAMLTLWLWNEGRCVRWLLLFYAAIVVALYAKGPPALAFPLLAIVGFYWKRKEERRKIHWVLGFIAAIVLVLLWFIPARMSLPSATSAPVAESAGLELYKQIIGRALLGTSKAQPPWYYLVNAPWTFFPWVLFLPWTILWCRKRWKDSPQMRYLLSWTAPAFIFFSIVIGKRPYYLLPLYPALSILLAWSILDLVDEGRRAWLNGVAIAWSVVLLLLAAAPLALRYTAYHAVYSNALLVVSVMFVGFALNTIWVTVKKRRNGLHLLIATQFTGLLVVCALVVFPMINPYKSARAFCRPLDALSLAHRDYRLYSVGLSREEYIFYSRHFHKPVLTDTLPLPPGLSAAQKKRALKLQYKTRRAIVKAVDQVPIKSFGSVTPNQIKALDAKLDAAVKLVQLDPKLAAEFEKTLTAKVNKFAVQFEQPTPAFMFVQQQDWRWLLPLHPAFRTYPVVIDRSVGSRDMLLIANKAGVKELRQLINEKERY